MTPTKPAALLIASLLFVSPSTQASDAIQSVCAAASTFAEVIMDMRQDGFPVSKIMELTDDDSQKNIVLAAYDKPRRSTPEQKKVSVENFRDEIYSICIRSIPKP